MAGRQERNSKLLRKTLITSLVSASTYVLTNVLNRNADEVWKLTVTVVIGGAALIVQYLMDFEERLNSMEQSLSAHHGELRTAVEKSFAGINEATELFSQVDRSVLRSDGVTRLARAYTQLGHQESELVKTFSQEEIGRLATQMESLSSGSVTCMGENNDWLIDLTTCVGTSIDATSTDVDRQFWYSEAASRYLKAQEDAFRNRNVTVRRLFLVRTQAEVTEELERLCQSHRDLGIQTRIAVRESLAPSARLRMTNDFIVFDGELCYETTPDMDQKPAETSLKTDKEHIEERVNRFNVIWDATEPVNAPGAAPGAASAGSGSA
ncbi:DUF6879 family protein [Streptomyces sp. NBC_01451]|uniref:DUF6879 family protein n=1 Tax=Streptomyces sp. NBC_01451 TaxID=2903872 RepID=UPI002E323A0A|nr:DUF6879 family protein [Streptomyces sp. NBC_01451]